MSSPGRTIVRTIVPDAPVVIVGSAALLLAIAASAAGAVGLLAEPFGTVTVLALGSVFGGALLLWRMRAVRRRDTRSVRVIAGVDVALLGLTVLGLIVSYVSIVNSVHGVWQWAFEDLGEQLWTLLLLAVLTAPARTVGVKVILGSVAFGFFGATMLAKIVSDPIVDALSAGNPVATSLWVPIIEEVAKATPAALFALLALRSARSRPAVVDVIMIGAASGAGFALMENLQYSRVYGAWNSLPPLSWLFPSIDRDRLIGPNQFDVGHTGWTACAAVGIGFAVLYARRFRFAWLAAVVGLIVPILEHAVVNSHDQLAWLAVPVLGGCASAVIATLGTLVFAVVERRPLRGPDGILPGLLLREQSLSAQRRRLADRQSRASADRTEEKDR